MKRGMNVVLLVFLISTLIVACGGGNGNNTSKGSTNQETNGGKVIDPKDEKVTLQIAHHMGEEGARLWVDDFIKTFEDKYPNVTVEPIATSSDNYHTMLRTKIAGDDAPDVMLLARLDSSDRVYLEEGYIADLTEQPFLDNVIGIENHQIDGKIYGMPFDMNAYAVMYNKDLFEQAGITEVPRTHSEFLNTLEKLKQANITAISAGFKEQNIVGSLLNVDIFNSLISKNPNHLRDLEERKTQFVDDEGMKVALERFIERFQYVQNDPFGTDRTTFASLVASGEAAMLMDGSWMIDAIKNINPDVNLGVFPFPYSENPDDNRLPLGTGVGGWAVYENSPNKEWALKLLEVIASKEMGESLQKNKKAVSIIKGLGEATDPTFEDITEYQNNDMVYDYTGAYTSFQPEYRTAFQQQLTALLLDSNPDVDAILKKMDEEFDRIHQLK